MDFGNFSMQNRISMQLQDLKRKSIHAMIGMIFRCQLIFKWKVMTVRNMSMWSIHGMEGKRLLHQSYLSDLILWLAMSRNLYCPNNGREREYLSLFRAWKVPLLSGSMGSLSDTVKTALRHQNLNSHRQYKRKTNWLFRCLSGVLRVG